MKLILLVSFLFSTGQKHTDTPNKDSLQIVKEAIYSDSVNSQRKIKKETLAVDIQQKPNIASIPVKKAQHFELSINGGFALPIGQFGSSQYSWIGSTEPIYAGFANSGYICNITFSFLLKKNWAITISGDYTHNSFNASGYMQQNISYYANPEYYIYNPQAIGNYSYNQYAIMGGVTKNIPINKLFNLGFRVLAGQFFAKVPTVRGIADTNLKLYGNTVNINLPEVESGRDLGVDIGIVVTIKVFCNFFILLNSNFILAQPPTLNNNVPYTSGISLFNSTLGIMYKF